MCDDAKILIVQINRVMEKGRLILNGGFSVYFSFVSFFYIDVYKSLFCCPKAKLQQTAFVITGFFQILFFCFFLEGKLAQHCWELFVPYGKLSQLRFRIFCVEVRGRGGNIICVVLETVYQINIYLTNYLLCTIVAASVCIGELLVELNSVGRTWEIRNF